MTAEGAPAVRRLSGEDAVFVYAETPSMPMHTMGTLILDPSTVSDGDFDYARVVRTIESRIHLIPPFRQRLIEVPLGLDHPVLADDPDFRVENHVHRSALPSPGTLRELAELVGDIAGRLLDRSRPLWEMWLVEGLEGGKLAVITKMHHCMIDGASGSSQMAQLLDLEPDPPLPEDAPAWNPDPLPSRLDLARSALAPRFTGPLVLGRLLLGTAKGLIDRRRAKREVARASTFSMPPRTRFGSAITPHRSVAYGSAPLEDIKLVKNAFGVTVNDAVLAACALSLRRYLAAHDDLPDEPLVCAVPVSLKSEQEKQEFSNKVSLLFIDLPTHRDDPEEVIRAVHEDTQAAKHVFSAVEGDLVQGWLDLAPLLLVRLGARLYADLDVANRVPMPMSCAVSNMPGPPIPLYWAGARVLATYPMGPVGEGMGINITVLSNMGRLDLGVLACEETVPDVWDIAEGFSQAVTELKLAAEKRMGGGAPDIGSN
jgi:WS/DGAT/MGAT family acyltransferase